MAAVSARSPAPTVTVRVPDQRAVGRRSIRPAVRVPDHSANGAAFIRAMVRYEDQATIAEPALRPLVRDPDHAERRTFQAAIGAPMIVVVRRYERWAFQASGDETRMAGTPR